jgi:predicted ATPase/serine phosphatase RsbU (regulator of sigma subunit)/tRNA A-37 threonylcarbamoyl transferase component Bud32
MLKLDGYQILTQIYESANSLVYRGIQQKDNQSVILKVLKQDYPTPSELTRYKQEYEITRNLNVEGAIAAYALEPYQRTLVIILEDFGGLSLKQLMNDRMGSGTEALSLQEFLKIAIETAEILGQIHSSNVIHKDINPANIVFNPETGQVKIIDFGISTVLTRENPTLKNPNVLEGTLAYMSPEQTGRMNRSLDYRTDFYSLGVTFYELLTGQLPFQTTDALELVHCHIAKVPMSPHQVNPEIPLAVSDIVMKLMAKTAEERYQSAWGIKADLEECLTQFQTKGEICEFPLGDRDISDKFQIPQKLYGREVEVETLLAAFDRVAAHADFDTDARINADNPQSKTEMMLVTGYSGIGKSSLVAEIHKPNTRLRGYFIEGKFDQFQRNVPYSAIVSAFKGLVRQLLTESELQLNLWREKLLAAFGDNGQVIIDVIPEVELIVGKQPLVPELGPSESQNRFNLVFGKFIRAFCTKEHPLVIFLDDLQWADSATLKLIELMMTDTDMQYLFLIGAYRDNEVSPTHPLMMTLDGLRNLGATINSITLAPLALENISQLIADTLHSDTASVKPLAKLVKRKTEGNPFFVNQFLKTLHAENLITFNLPTSVTKEGSKGGFSWQWDIAQIEAQNISDNVVELMIGKLRKLPESTQQILRLASCIGANFDLNTLSIIIKKSTSKVYSDLTAAIQSGLILPVSELDEELLIQDYKFLHDRVQQAAYTLIDEEQKTAVHLQIGRLLLQNTAPSSLLEEIFEIVDHLNLGVELVTHQEERDEIAKLNLMAGKKAKAATAHGAALEYLNTGLKLLSADSWQTSYDLTLALYEEAAEAAYLNGDFEQIFVRHWKEHVRTTLKSLLEGSSSGLETGDPEFAALPAFMYCYHSYFIGKELCSLEREMTNYCSFMEQIKQEVSLNYTKIYRQIVLNLLGQAEAPCILTGSSYNEETMLKLHQLANDRYAIGNVYINKLILCYLFGVYPQAVENATIANQYLDGLIGALLVPLFHFYDSLARLAVYADAAAPEQKGIFDKVRANQEKMQKWAHHAPMNYLHKFYLVEAERYRVLGQYMEAMDYYDKAIAGAKENEYINEEALAYELAAKFYMARDKQIIARTYMSEAHYAYTRWGALAKVKDLEAKYPQLLSKSSSRPNITSTHTTNHSTATGSQSASALDLATVMKASQAISGEIVLDKLLASLMKILIENAGAQVGYLILESQGQLLIEAEGAIDSDNVAVLQSIPIKNRLPNAIINYVVRTRESIVLSDATVEGNFTQDSYIQHHQPKSILCFPLINQGQLVSIIYLENNLTTGAFTPERLEVLKILSAQAAISIENARLYQTLEDKVSERTTQLAQANAEITALNEKLKAENLRMSAELEVTKQLQQMVLPKPEELELIEGLEIAGFMEPADEVGGDYYDVLQQNGRVKIGIGDVTGHGLESGVVMLMAQTAVRTLQESQVTDPVQFMDILNRTIYRNIQRINPYKNLTLSLFDYADGILSVSGQHEEIIVVRAGGQLELLDTIHLGFPLGLEEEIAEFIAQEQVQLNPGDVVVLYTDGITEAFDINHMQYGLERLCEVVSRNCHRTAQEIQQAVIEDVRQYIGSQKVFDDITLVVLKQK